MTQYKLVIAEKPSVAKSIAAVLKATNRKDGYLEGGGFLVSWCVGHLVELADASTYAECYAKWALSDLPILPEHWKYVITPDTKKQFDTLKQLMARDDVTSLVCATDAGREGELIFRLVYEQAKCKKPVERLWISSMEDSAIREGFAHLRPFADYDSLYRAALCRARADWMVGINATRLFSCLYHRTLNIGRVMTPTLALIVQREADIDAFKPTPFYTVTLGLSDFAATGERLADKAQAEAVQAACMAADAAVIKSVERKEKTEKPPALYDLTTLQREANRLLGFTAQQTLDYLQSLYEKKLATYPRTDSRYLTSDMTGSLPVLVNAIAKAMPFVSGIAVRCNPAQVVNDAKVSDHHAIIPTQGVKDADLSGLPAGERSLLHLIAARLLCAVGQPYIQNGDYQIPNLILEEQTEVKPLGKYGRMRKNYLKEHRTVFYNNLLLSGKLTAHLQEIDETANRRLEQMMPELAKAAGVTESLKASDPMQWVGLMNNCKAQAEEMILTELIYN